MRVGQAGGFVGAGVAAGDQTLRVLPPLVLGNAEMDEFFEKLSAGAASYDAPQAA